MEVGGPATLLHTSQRERDEAELGFSICVYGACDIFVNFAGSAELNASSMSLNTPSGRQELERVGTARRDYTSWLNCTACLNSFFPQVCEFKSILYVISVCEMSCAAPEFFLNMFELTVPNSSWRSSPII